MRGIHRLRRWDHLGRYDIHTKFHDDRFRHSSNIAVIIWTIWEAAVLVLLMGQINEERRWDGLRWHDIISSPRIQVILWLLSQHFERLQCWCYWGEGFMKYVIGMTWGCMTYIPSFMNIGLGILKILSLLPQQYESLQYWYWWHEGDGVIYEVRCWDGLRRYT
jgi:hypothetical protein